MTKWYHKVEVFDSMSDKQPILKTGYVSSEDPHLFTGQYFENKWDYMQAIQDDAISDILLAKAIDSDCKPIDQTQLTKNDEYIIRAYATLVKDCELTQQIIDNCKHITINELKKEMKALESIESAF
jgi:hypothetical protein